MQLALSPGAERFIHEQVKTGRFPSPEALVEAALAEFCVTDDVELDDQAVEAINEGLDQADRGEGTDLETFREQFFKRHSGK